MTPAILRLMLRPTLSKVKLGPEDVISIDFANRPREWTITRRLIAVWTHIPNEVAGGSKNAGLRYAIAKALGMISGAADYVFLWDGGSAAIEMKAPKGTQSGNQSDFQKWCELMDVPYYVTRSADEAEEKLRTLGILK
ncbi:hypothetical protein ABE527_18570 [Brucella sp. TWI432]